MTIQNLEIGYATVPAIPPAYMEDVKHLYCTSIIEHILHAVCPPAFTLHPLGSQMQGENINLETTRQLSNFVFVYNSAVFFELLKFSGKTKKGGFIIPDDNIT